MFLSISIGDFIEIFTQRLHKYKPHTELEHIVSMFSKKYKKTFQNNI